MDVVIVGGGFSGALFGLKLYRAQPDWRIVIVEPRRKLGRGFRPPRTTSVLVPRGGR